jgi:cysteine desulfurase
MIYLDNNATTRIAPEVRTAIEPFLEDHYANPSSPYTPARKSSLAIADARAALADLLGARPEEVIFTSGGTESTNAAFHAATTLQSDRRHLVTSTVEHSATLESARHYEKMGYRVTYVPVDGEGRLDEQAYLDALSPNTALVSLMAANNESGVIFPVHRLAQAAADRDIPFHCDATQVIGKIPFQLDGPAITYLSLSGHKIHAPKGVGALIARGTCPPLLLGGGQEQGRRSGTENVLGIVGLGAATQLAPSGCTIMEQSIQPLIDRIDTMCTCPHVRTVGTGARRLPNTSFLLVRESPAEAVLALLDMEGICCSSGSACASGAAETSHVLSAMGISPDWAAGGIRVTLSRYTQPAEVETFILTFRTIVERLRGQVR